MKKYIKVISSHFSDDVCRFPETDFLLISAGGNVLINILDELECVTRCLDIPACIGVTFTAQV